MTSVKSGARHADIHDRGCTHTLSNGLGDSDSWSENILGRRCTGRCTNARIASPPAPEPIKRLKRIQSSIGAIVSPCRWVAAPRPLRTQPYASRSRGDIPTDFKTATAADDYVKRDVMIPMRDGVKLHTVIVIPKGASRAPYQLPSDIR
jgi:hypothetical protein